MKVKELIQALQEFPEEQEVKIFDYDSQMYRDISEIHGTSEPGSSSLFVALEPMLYRYYDAEQ